MQEVIDVTPEAKAGRFVTFPGSPFELFQPYPPAGDQPVAIDKLVEGVLDGEVFQTLLGVTGSGKTFTMANVIARLGRPAIVFAPNKTLAAQLYSEFREFFPNNAVEYFVSYYDYYWWQSSRGCDISATLKHRCMESKQPPKGSSCPIRTIRSRGTLWNHREIRPTRRLKGCPRTVNHKTSRPRRPSPPPKAPPK